MPWKVLIVDDDPLIRATLSAMMSRAGHGCTTAPDALTGIQLAETGTFDAAFVDVHMPGINGLEVLKAVGKQPSPIRVIVMSGSLEDVDTLQTLMRFFGGSAFLAKPFTQARLLHVLDAVMNADQS